MILSFLTGFFWNEASFAAALIRAFSDRKTTPSRIAQITTNNYPIVELMQSATTPKQPKKQNTTIHKTAKLKAAF